MPPALLVGRWYPSVGVFFLALIIMNRIMHLRTGASGCLETEADLDAFDRLHRHHGLGQSSIEFGVPLGVRAEAEGATIDAHLDDAAKRVAIFSRLVDKCLDVRVAVQIETVKFALVADRFEFFQLTVDRLDPFGADFEYVAEDVDVKCRQQLFCQRSSCYADRRPRGPTRVRARRECCPDILRLR